MELRNAVLRNSFGVLFSRKGGWVEGEGGWIENCFVMYSLRRACSRRFRCYCRMGRVFDYP